MHRYTFALTALILSCGNPPATSQDAPPPTSEIVQQQLGAPDFCSAYAERVCDVHQACSCDVDPQDCLDDNVESCRAALITEDVMIAVESGTMSFDAERAEAILAKLAEGAESCARPLEVLEWSRGDLVDFGGMFVGNLEPGEKCSIRFAGLGPNECRDGICADKDGGLECVGVVRVGEACGVDEAGVERRCLQHKEAAGPEVGRVSLMFSPCVEGICEMRRGDNHECESDAWCKSMRCERIVSPTTKVDVHVYLDARTSLVEADFSVHDAKSYSHRVEVPIVDADGERYDADVYVRHVASAGAASYWTYVAIVDESVIALGALAFDEYGRLAAEYAMSGNARVGASRFGPIAFDFGPSLHEGENGKDGSRVFSRDFAVRRVVGDQRVSTPFCAEPLGDGTACDGDYECRSGVCRGVCVVQADDGVAWCW